MPSVLKAFKSRSIVGSMMVNFMWQLDRCPDNWLNIISGYVLKVFPDDISI